MEDSQSKKDLGVLKDNLLRYIRYPAQKCRAMAVQVRPELTYMQAAELLALQEDVVLRSAGYWAIAHFLKKKEPYKLQDGRPLLPKELLVEALSCHPRFAECYYSLCFLMANDETVFLFGREFTFEQLCLEPLTWETYPLSIFVRLAQLLPSVKLDDGRTLDRMQMLLEPIRLEPLEARHYHILGLNMMMNATPTVMLPNGQNFSSKELFIEALRLDMDVLFLYHLGKIMKINETATLACGRVVGKTQLYIEAIRLDPTYCDAYTSLATTLDPFDTVQLLDGRTLGELDLYQESLKYNPRDPYCFFNMGYILPPECVLPMNDGSLMNKEQLFIKAIECDAMFWQAYSNLARMLYYSNSATITLTTGEVLSERDLFCEAYHRNPKFDRTLLSQLSQFIPGDECWSRKLNSTLYKYFGNKLFATLLMGLQRLETAGVLQLHYSVLEDVLESWTWSDELLCVLNLL